MESNKKAGIPQGIIIIIIGFLPVMAIVALMPIVPSLRNTFSDLPNIDTLAPLALSAPGLLVAIFAPYAGYLTDKLGRRKLLLIFTLLYGIGGIMPFFIESFQALLTGRFILGIGEAFILTIGNTLLGDYFEEKDRNKWIMWQAIIGTAIGPLTLMLSGALSAIAWNYPFLIYSISFLVSGAAYFFIFEPGKNKIQETKPVNKTTEKFPLIKMIWMALATMIASICYFVYTLQFSMALDTIGVLDVRTIANYSAIASIAVPFGALFFKLIAKKDSRLQFAILFIILGIGLTLIGLASNIYSVIGGAWIQQFGAGMAIPVFLAWGLRTVPSEFRGRGMGFWTSGFFLGQFLSPVFFTGMKNITGSLLSAFIAFGILCLIIAIYNFSATRISPEKQ